MVVPNILRSREPFENLISGLFPENAEKHTNSSWCQSTERGGGVVMQRLPDTLKSLPQPLPHSGPMPPEPPCHSENTVREVRIVSHGKKEGSHQEWADEGCQDNGLLCVCPIPTSEDHESICPATHWPGDLQGSCFPASLKSSS